MSVLMRSRDLTRARIRHGKVINLFQPGRFVSRKSHFYKFTIRKLQKHNTNAPLRIRRKTTKNTSSVPLQVPTFFILVTFQENDYVDLNTLSCFTTTQLAG